MIEIDPQNKDGYDCTHSCINSLKDKVKKSDLKLIEEVLKGVLEKDADNKKAQELIKEIKDKLRML